MVAIELDHRGVLVDVAAAMMVEYHPPPACSPCGQFFFSIGTWSAFRPKTRTR